MTKYFLGMATVLAALVVLAESTTVGVYWTGTRKAVRLGATTYTLVSATVR